MQQHRHLRGVAVMGHIRHGLADHRGQAPRDRRGRRPDIVAQPNVEIRRTVERVCRGMDLRGEIRAVILQIVDGTADHRHRLVRRIVDLREPPGGIVRAAGFGHQPSRLGLHDGAGEQMADVVMDIAGDAHAFVDGGRMDGRGAFLAAVGEPDPVAAQHVPGLILDPGPAGVERVAASRGFPEQRTHRRNNDDEIRIRPGLPAVGTQSEQAHRQRRDPQPARHGHHPTRRPVRTAPAGGRCAGTY